MKNICDWNNCNEHGEFKAPVEKDNSKKYRLLCLKHIKEFNKKWNYFENMSEDEINNFIKADMTWHKPTQNFSAQDNFFKVLWNNTLNEGIKKNLSSNEYNKLGNFIFSDKDIKAFEILGLSASINWYKIREKFKKLVKKFHPDMNSGNKKFEEKLKIITLAYTQLKRTLNK
tara:strand:+ start:15426 stop:15941 length:516 start_codon:yes stop_codon:yes gene_type:complete